MLGFQEGLGDHDGGIEAVLVRDGFSIGGDGLDEAIFGGDGVVALLGGDGLVGEEAQAQRY